MSAWNSVLQGLHSALIDELNHIYPDEKPELGLPSRHQGFHASKNATHACLARVTVSEGFGLALLGFASQQKPEDVQAVFKAVIERALKNEFPRRNIVPQFGKMQNFAVKSPPSDMPQIQMVIWLPISVSLKNQTLIFDLGVAV